MSLDTLMLCRRGMQRELRPGDMQTALSMNEIKPELRHGLEAGRCSLAMPTKQTWRAKFLDQREVKKGVKVERQLTHVLVAVVKTVGSLHCAVLSQHETRAAVC